MSLVVVPPGRPARPVISVDANGQVIMHFGGSQMVATLASEGCLRSAGGELVGEVTGPGEIWTPYQLFQFDRDSTGARASHRIAADGVVTLIAADGSEEPLTSGRTFRFDGFAEGGRCTAHGAPRSAA